MFVFPFSNNNIQDDGVHDLLEGLINQVHEDKDGKGLSILILWNNRLTKKSSPYFSRIIVSNLIYLIIFKYTFEEHYYIYIYIYIVYACVCVRARLLCLLLCV